MFLKAAGHFSKTASNAYRALGTALTGRASAQAGVAAANSREFLPVLTLIPRRTEITAWYRYPEGDLSSDELDRIFETEQKKIDEKVERAGEFRFEAPERRMKPHKQRQKQAESSSRKKRYVRIRQAARIMYYMDDKGVKLPEIRPRKK